MRVASIELTLLSVPVPASGGLLLLALIGLLLNNKLRKR
ncbi:PEP-CTERM sorting domain-containing protein [Cognatiyoonia sp.]